MTEASKQSDHKITGWAQFVTTWLIAAAAAVLIALGLTNLAKIIYKSTLTKYPIESYRYLDINFPPSDIKTSPIKNDNEVKAPELSKEDQQKNQERETEQRVLQKINDYGVAFGQLLAGIGLALVFWLMRRSKE